MNAQILTGLTPDLYSEWMTLWNASGARRTAFNSPAWLKAAVNAFDQHDVKIVTVRTDGGELAAVAALVKYREYGLSVYAAPAREFADKQPVLVDWSNWDAVNELVRGMKTLGIVSLGYCTEETKVRLQHAANGRGVVFQDDVNYIVDMSQGPHGDLSSSSKSKIRRTMKKLGTRVKVEFSDDGVTDLFTAAHNIEEHSVKHSRGMGVMTRQDVRNFYEILAALHPELVTVTAISAGDTPVAYSIELLANGTYQGSQKAYRKGYEQFQPGKYMIMKRLEHAYEKGYRTFDFGRGSSELKKHFTETAQPLYTVIFTDRPFAGFYLYFVATLRHIAYDTVVKQRALYKAFKTARVALNI